MPAPIIWNRKPLPQNQYAPLPESAIHPRGWLSHKKTQEVDEEALERFLQMDGVPDSRTIREMMRLYSKAVDIRIPQHLMRLLKKLHDALQTAQMNDAKQAANLSDILHAALWLYNLTGQKALLSLCKLLKMQSPDWTSTLHIFPEKKAVGGNKKSDDDAYWRTHGTVIAASLKAPALQALFEGGMKNEMAFRVGWDKLMRYHGAAHGLFNADPLLAGTNPSRSVSSAIILEMLHTLSVLLWAQGDPFCGDLLETIAFNALSAASGLQAANQLMKRPGKSIEAEGIALLLNALWMVSSDGGLAAISYAPCEVRWRIGGELLHVVVDTTYPEEETVRIVMNCQRPLTFPLHLRIPAWAEGAKVSVNEEDPLDCVAGDFFVLRRKWKQGDSLRLILPMRITLLPCARKSVSVTRGPLIYALPLDQDTPWQVALMTARPIIHRIKDAKNTIDAEVVPVPSWNAQSKKPGPLPILPTADTEKTYQVRLVPYGETAARIAQFPVGTEVCGE